MRYSLVSVLLTTAAAAQSAPTLRFERTPRPVTFTNGDVRLAGVLLKPRGVGPFPAVVIVHGAGPAIHNEPAFIVHANAFLRGGFAVLVYDKRGSGASTGTLDISDYGDLASDVNAAVNFLRARRDIVPTKIGILGRSEGAWVGTLAAQRDSSIAFVIMSSGAAVSPSDETLYWTRRSLRTRGVPDSVIRQALALKAAIWAYYRKVADDSGSVTDRRATRDSLVYRFRDFQQYQPEMPPSIMDPSTDDVREFRAFVRIMYYDPRPTLEAIHVPLLEALGENDEVVEPATTIAALERLRSAGHDVTIRTFPGVGHSLLVMDGTRIVGYATGYLPSAIQWAQERIDGERAKH